jgi:YggT family protein
MDIIQDIIGNLLQLVVLLIFLQSLLSWVIRDGRNEFMNLLSTITNPILEPFRRIQDRFFGNSGIDISPLLAIIVLQTIRRAFF